jgi:mannose-6-phosphate isomerase
LYLTTPADQARMPGRGLSGLYVSKTVSGSAKLAINERGSRMDHRPPSIKVDKPWGRFEQYTHNLPSTVKIITVAPGGTLSRQYHHRRDELWVILDKGARVQLGEEVLEPETGEKIFIPRGTVHRLSAAGEREVRILEISFGEFDEEDIVRLDDVYGRVVQ